MIKLFGKKIHIITAFRDYWIVPSPEATYKIFKDGIEIDERNTSEPMLYLIRLGDQMNEFLAKLEAHSTVSLYAKKVRVSRKTLEKDYDFKIKEDGYVIGYKRKGLKEVSYDKFEFIGCKIVR